jgi:serine/threonine-protein kinase
MSGPPPLPPSIGRYRPIGVLGSGAMGTVYKAHDPAIDRIVAIKLTRTDALEQEMRDEYIERFKREVQTAGRCNHAAIVRVFDFSGNVHNPFIVMEMVDGVPLNHLLRDPARRVEQTIIPVLVQVLDGLGYAHRLGMTHRDVKPGNILVSPEGQAKIVDFGIARLAEGSMTQAGSMLGTPSYMSPEQVSESDVDYRADLFSVGAILYEAFAGKPPFVGRNLSDTILRLSLPDPAPMDPILAAGAGAFIPVLERALAKRREARFQSAEEFAAALGASLGAGVPSVAPDHTVLMAGGAMAPRPPAPSPATLTGTIFESRWDPQVLDRIERTLAAYAGPVARVMVREAARASTTADELVQALAQRLATASDRSQFLRAVTTAGTGSGQGSLAATVLGQAAPPSFFSGQTTIGRTLVPGAPGAPIAPAAIEAAQAALAVFVGPMARVFARKAAAEAASPGDFIERLCAHVAKPDDNKALRRKLQAEVEPKLRA